MVGSSTPSTKKLALPNLVDSVFMWCIAYCYSDFGMAQHLTINEVAESFRGSPLYMAPEILQGQSYDAKVDLWSVGVILFGEPFLCGYVQLVLGFVHQ
jgi:serine/threonine protein kinase